MMSPHKRASTLLLNWGVIVGEVAQKCVFRPGARKGVLSRTIGTFGESDITARRGGQASRSGAVIGL